MKNQKKNEIKLEKEANNIIENKIIPNKIEEKKLEFKKHDSPIKNIIKNFRNIDNNNKIEPDLFSNRNQRPKKLVLGKEKKISINYIPKENFNTVNNDDLEIKNNLNLNENKNKNDININQNINLNINNENKNLNINNENKNLNINNENKNKNEIIEEDDLDTNININNLLNSNNNISNNINNNNNNQNNDIIENIKNINKEAKKELLKREPVNIMKRPRSVSNINILMNQPQDIPLFSEINIFDAILLMLSHNYYIHDYLHNHKEKIYKCEENNEFCLSSILYYINEYMWNRRPSRIIEIGDLKEKYREFLNIYIQTNCKDNNPQFYCYNNKNLEYITDFIYNKINKEITYESQNYIKKQYNSNNPKLDRFFNSFILNNKSMISDNFIGFIVEMTFCSNCQSRMYRYGNFYQPNDEYNSIYYISFDLESIFQSNSYFNPRMSFDGSFFNNQFSNINQNNSLNIYSCLNKEFKKKIQTYCKLCNFTSQIYIQKQYYTFPKILTIILNNNKEGSFKIDSEINLSSYSYFKTNPKYVLISILSKLVYNDKYILYCFNYKDGNWYSYYKKEGYFSKIVKRVNYLDPNAIPLLLLYQDATDMAFEYNSINLGKANNKQSYIFKFQNGIPQKTLYFDINAKVKDVCIEIEKIFKLKSIKLVINGEKKNNNDLLYYVASNAPSILVIPS